MNTGTKSKDLGRVSTSTGGDIKKIGKESIIQICSSQVVIDLKSAVKEPVENSLDAGAKSIRKIKHLFSISFRH